MEDLNDLYYFARVVEHGGFAAAERATGVPKSKLSRRLAVLEERLGSRLLHRSTRHFSVTEVGKVFYEHCRAMLVEAEAAHEAVEATRAEPAGTVRMSCPVTLLHVHIGAMLADFLAAHPRVSLQLAATNRKVEPVNDGVDLAIRVRPPPLPDSDLVMRVLADSPQCIVGSPKLLGAMSPPNAPEDLAAFPSLSLGPAHSEHAWTMIGPDGTEAVVPHRPRMVTGDMVALRTAACAGVGIVQLPTLMLREDLASGALVSLLPSWAPPRQIIHAVYPSRRCLLPAVRTLLDHLAERFGALEQG